MKRNIFIKVILLCILLIDGVLMLTKYRYDVQLEEIEKSEAHEISTEEMHHMQETYELLLCEQQIYLDKIESVLQQNDAHEKSQENILSHIFGNWICTNTVSIQNCEEEKSEKLNELVGSRVTLGKNKVSMNGMDTYTNVEYGISIMSNKDKDLYYQKSEALRPVDESMLYDPCSDYFIVVDFRNRESEIAIANEYKADSQGMLYGANRFHYVSDDEIVFQIKDYGYMIMERGEREETGKEIDFACISGNTFWEALDHYLFYEGYYSYNEKEKLEYDIYATNHSDYALVSVGKMENSFSKKNFIWIYYDESLWKASPVTYCDDEETVFELGGCVENVEFHHLSGLAKDILFIQLSDGQGLGDTFIYSIHNGKLENMGCIKNSVYYWTYFSIYKDIFENEEGYKFFYSCFDNDGKLKVIFNDINSDGKEEMTLFGNRVFFETTETDVKGCSNQLPIREIYSFVDGRLVKYAVDDNHVSLSGNETRNVIYTLTGNVEDFKHQILFVRNPNETGSLYTAEWKGAKAVTSEVSMVGDGISKIKLVSVENQTRPLIITEQTCGDNRTYQVYEWGDNDFKVVFTDEWRNYSLNQEMEYLTGETYNSYSLELYDFDGDGIEELLISGCKVLLDEKQSVLGVDNVKKVYTFQDGCYMYSQDLSERWNSH